VVATWGLAGGIVSITPLEPTTPGAIDALVDDAADVLRFLGLPSRPAVVNLTARIPMEDRSNGSSADVIAGGWGRC
jgi:hypothetical protein